MLPWKQHTSKSQIMLHRVWYSGFFINVFERIPLWVNQSSVEGLFHCNFQL